MNEKIPYGRHQLDESDIESVVDVLRNKPITQGQIVEDFGQALADFTGAKYGIAVSSGTADLHISVAALNIQRGDEVITVSNTAVPTITAIVNAGARPRFIDVNENYLMNYNKIESAINKNTKAIIPVHLYGQTCDMKEISKIKKKYNLKIIEDCAQSTGAMYKKKQSGGFGDIGCFSFYPTKILGAYGDAGFLTTNNIKLYNKMRRIRLMGMESNIRSKSKFNKKYYAIEHGTNSRLDEIQASILNVKLRFIKYYISRRRQIAKIYNDNLKQTDLVLPKEVHNNFHVYYQYVVAHDNRDQIIKKLLKKNIYLNIIYPYPIHKMQPYKRFFQKKYEKLRKTENFAKQIFSLPTYPSIKDSNIEKIIKEINQLI